VSARRRQLALAGFGAAALAAGVGFAFHRSRAVDPSSAAVASLYSQTFNDADGTPQSLAQWKGKWLVLNFWATWCAPCVEEMPTLQQIAHDYGRRGVAVVGLAVDRPDAVRQFRSELKLELPLLVAGVNGSELARQLGNVSGALPYTVLISPRGTLVQARLGLIKPELLRAWLDAQLAS